MLKHPPDNGVAALRRGVDGEEEEEVDGRGGGEGGGGGGGGGVGGGEVKDIGIIGSRNRRSRRRGEGLIF